MKYLTVAFYGFLALLILVLLIAMPEDNASTPASVDPCSDEVMDAPYESGSKYMYRDQAAERTEACIADRLDR